MFAIFIGTYVATSYVLFKYPQILHKKKNNTLKCRNICHRGGSWENVENTIEAFQNSIQNSGSDMLELDCHLTKDKKVVVVHDNELTRLTGKAIQIATTDYKDIPPLLPSLMKGHRRENDTTHQIAYKIPLLDEVFQKFPNIPINIDIKVYDKFLVTEVARLIKEYRRENITVWGSFQDRIVKECWKNNQNVPLYFSLKRVALLIIFYYTGLLPFVPIKESYLEIPVPRAVRKITGDKDMPTSKKLLLFLADKPIYGP
ncbi:lysophospholipase D GDPD1-like isoform X2 [Gordionus sp. m RMFG-2023]|uniref:lysophospholipase D GDPD1-like isoform X2 n=1 Tax=Gordionus sp. m RMFG-2023 TaxID=3053472 RepID=UPI0031FD2A37